MYPSLRGRAVIVTGGGRGLGREMALALAEAGALVAITAASAKGAAELQNVCRQGQGLAGRLLALTADVRDYRDCRRVVETTLGEFGALHCLVNNAGRGMRLISETFTTEPSRFWQADPDAWREIVDVNLNGAFNMTRAATPHLLKQALGKIVNVSTSVQTMTRRGYSPYGPSKAALEACSQVWAQDLQNTGVSVNVLLPGGATATELLPAGASSGADGLLLAPHIMRAPALWLCADESNGLSGKRFIARLWDENLPPDEAAARAGQPLALPATG